jgi:hypothetical protein
MPPIAPGPTGDPQGFGPMGGFGPPPGPMFPNPGPYAAPTFQPGPGAGAGGGYNTAPHFWSSFEYLLYYSKSQSYTLPLLTTSAPTDLGLPGRPSTFALAGGGNVSLNPLNGARITAGFFGDADRRFGFEASGFLTEQRANIVDASTSPSGIPLLARPFFDSLTPNAFNTLIVGSPSLGTGRVIVSNSQQTYSAEASGVVNLYRSQPGCATAWTIDALAGYRYLELHEQLQVTSGTLLNLPSTSTDVTSTGAFGQVTVVGTTTTTGAINVAGLSVPNGSLITIGDSINVRNQFNGAQFGLRGEVRHGMFTLSASGKIAIGLMHEIVDINGYTQLTPGVAGSGTPVSGRAVGGLFANSSNIGRYVHDEFTTMPEINMNLGMAVTKNVTVWLGYNFLYINNVARPSTELNTLVNTGTVPLSPNYGATNRPLVRQNLFNQDDFWLMGLNTGFTIRF